jgi:hypothetical protein
MALSAARTTSRGQVHGRTATDPVVSGSIIYDGALTAWNAAGTGFVPLDKTTTGLKFAGYAIRGGVGTAGDNAVVERRGTRWLPHAGTATAAMVGGMAYGDSDEKVTDVPPSQSGGFDHVIGRIIDIDTATNEMKIDLEDSNAREVGDGIGGVGSYGLVEAKTGDYTVLAADHGKTFTTVGAAGTVTFAMPAAVLGHRNEFRVGAAQELRIDPNGTEVIALPSTGVAGAAGKYLTANADGETVEIECTKAGQWSVFGFTGTWTAEA